MSSTQQTSDGRWIVHLAATSKSAVVVEVHMSAEKAAELVESERARISKLGSEGLFPVNLGTAVLGLFAREAG